MGSLNTRMKSGVATFQEIFNFAWKWIVTEQHPRCANEMGCLYRGENGNRCVIGAMIPNKDYDPDWDNSCVGSYDVACQLGWDNKYHVLLAAIQSCHDTNTLNYFEEAEKDLRLVAVETKMIIPTD